MARLGPAAGLFACVCVLVSARAHAQSRGVYPLGMTAVGSGVTPEPGFTYANQLLFYARDESKADDGSTLPVSGQNAVIMDMNSFVWVSKLTVLGGADYSAVATLPIAKNQLVSDIHGQLSGGGGFADSYYLPLILGWNRERTSLRALVGFLAPTGRFAEGASDNVGSGYWTPTLSSGQTVQITRSNSVTFSAFELYEWHTTQQGTGTQARRHDQSRLLVGPDVRVRERPDPPAGRRRRVRAAPDDGEERTGNHRRAIPRTVRHQRARVRGELRVSESASQCRRQVLRGIPQSRRVPGLFVSGVRGGEFLIRISRLVRSSRI